MKRVIIIGATSGIGYEVAKEYIRMGWMVGAAGRRIHELEKLKSDFPGSVEIQVLDVTKEDASERLQVLIEKTGGMDLFLLSSGIGFQNRNLDATIELNTVKTNGEGFVRMVTAAFGYFREKRSGHLAVISSIAGTKGLGVAPAYSATKRFQNTYIDALAQLARIEKLPVRFTDIRPGFVATALLKDGNYPLLMKPDKVARLIVHALVRQKRVCTIDYRYRIMVFFWRMIPGWLWERLPVEN